MGILEEDLYHRLNVFEINIEPLKNRVSDIPLLVEYFSEKISTNYNLKKLNIKFVIIIYLITIGQVMLGS